MTTILVVTSITHRALDQESLVRAWLKNGHRVVVLNFFNCNPFQITSSHDVYRFIPFEVLPGPFNLAKAIWKVVSLCWQYKVHSVIAHLEYPSFVSVIANFFVVSKVVVYRHHADYAVLNGLNSSLSYKFTYRFAPAVVVVSNHAKKIMVEKEKISARKIRVVPLAFDFKLFKEPAEGDVRAIRRNYQAEVLLLAVGRLTKLKRPHHAVDVLNLLIREGIDAKLIILGVGEEHASLEKYIYDNSLSHRAFLPGFSNDVLTFMAAADFIIHPSISESSSIVVKEAGLVKRPCIACRGVGDFDEYMVHEKNGFLVNQETFVIDTFNIIKSKHQDHLLLNEIGENLNNDILRLFEVSRAIEKVV